ncbi:hypothetical protein O1611_g5345 [Lasiodiplodia mahajangana]|uniref:Uncharacterized protein n=1 Tax=Lasiodiplodia mahajangana TaxID=1108764 RepID=A0ACC2JM58_9PEZI|nr:hypothetical protein O1611_g5345 [Lasiodiplodia mahajangana]
MPFADVDGVRVSDNARFDMKQTVQYGDVFHSNFLFSLLDPKVLEHLWPDNSLGPWTRSGTDHRLRGRAGYTIPYRPEPSPLSNNAKVSRDEIMPRISQVRDQKVKDIIARAKEVQDLYGDLQDICTGVVKSLEQKYTCLENIEEGVNVQKIRFMITSEALSTAVQHASLHEVRENILPYTQLIGQLETITQLLKDVPHHLNEILKKFQEAERMKPGNGETNSAEAYCPDQEFGDVLGNIEPCLDEFDRLARSLIKQPAMAEALEELGRLSNEALAATALFRCLASGDLDGKYKSTERDEYCHDSAGIEDVHSKRPRPGLRLRARQRFGYAEQLITTRRQPSGGMSGILDTGREFRPTGNADVGRIRRVA